VARFTLLGSFRPGIGLADNYRVFNNFREQAVSARRRRYNVPIASRF